MSANHVLACLVLPLVASVAGPRPEPASADRASETFTIDAGEHDLVDLVTRAGQFLDQTWLCTRMEFDSAAPILVLDSMQLDADETNRFIGHAAYTRGLVKVPLDIESGLWEWISVNGPRRNEITWRSIFVDTAELAEFPHPHVRVMTTVTCERLTTATVANALRPMLASGPPTALVSFGNMLTFDGDIEMVRKIVALIHAAEDSADEADRRATDSRMSRLEKMLERLLDAASHDDDD